MNNIFNGISSIRHTRCIFNKKFLFFLSKLRKIYAVNYNILKIMSGMGDLAYSN